MDVCMDRCIHPYTHTHTDAYAVSFELQQLIHLWVLLRTWGGRRGAAQGDIDLTLVPHLLLEEWRMRSFLTLSLSLSLSCRCRCPVSVSVSESVSVFARMH